MRSDGADDRGISVVLMPELCHRHRTRQSKHRRNRKPSRGTRRSHIERECIQGDLAAPVLEQRLHYFSPKRSATGREALYRFTSLARIFR